MILLSTGLVWAQDDSAMQSLRHAVELQQSGHYAEAIDAYRVFLKAHPEVAAVRSNLGAALAHEGRYTEAIQEYTLALKADSSNYGIRFNLGLAFYKMGDVVKAVHEFETVYTQGSRQQIRIISALPCCSPSAICARARTNA